MDYIKTIINEELLELYHLGYICINGVQGKVGETGLSCNDYNGICGCKKKCINICEEKFNKCCNIKNNNCHCHEKHDKCKCHERHRCDSSDDSHSSNDRCRCKDKCRCVERCNCKGKCRCRERCQCREKCRCAERLDCRHKTKLDKLILEEINKLICFGFIDNKGKNGPQGPPGESCDGTGILAVYSGSSPIAPFSNVYNIPANLLNIPSHINLLYPKLVTLITATGLLQGSLRLQSNFYVFTAITSSPINIQHGDYFVYGTVFNYINVIDEFTLTYVTEVNVTNNISSYTGILYPGQTVKFYSSNTGIYIASALISSVNGGNIFMILQNGQLHAKIPANSYGIIFE